MDDVDTVTLFDNDDCTCDHLPMEHDDGYGCTSPGCTCLAGWTLVIDRILIEGTDSE